MLLRVVSWVRVVLAAPVLWVSPGIAWFRCPPVAEVAGGDADGGVLPAMVCLMPLAWVM